MTTDDLGIQLEVRQAKGGNGAALDWLLGTFSVTNSVVFYTSDFKNLHDRHHDALQNGEVVHRFVLQAWLYCCST